MSRRVRPRSPASYRQYGALAFGLCWGGLVAALTLFPGSTPAGATPPWCVLCGAYGTADALLNVALFMPLGAALGFLLRRRGAMLAGLTFSFFIEFCQFAVVPGRDASLGDLATNSLGTLLGAMLAATWRTWVTPVPRTRRRLLAAWSVGTMALLLAIPVLFRPSLPASDWFGQWTPRLAHFEAYLGRLLSVHLGSEPLPPDRLDADRIRRLFDSGAPLTMRFTAAPPPAALAPVFAIHDGDQRECIVVAARGDDLVFRYRAAARHLRLDAPEFIFPDVLTHEPGDTVVLALTWVHPRVRLTLGERVMHAGPAPGDALAFLTASQDFLRPYARVLQLGLAAGLFLPLGLWAGRSRLAFAPLTACLLLLATLHLALPIRPAGIPLLVAAALGGVIGLLLRGRPHKQRALRHGSTASPAQQ